MPLSLGLLPLRSFALHNRFFTRLPFQTQRDFSSYKPLRSLLFKDKPQESTSNNSFFDSYTNNNFQQYQPRKPDSSAGNINLSAPKWGAQNLPQIQKVLWDGHTKASKETLAKFRNDNAVKISKGFSETQSDLNDEVILDFKDVEWPSFIEDALKNANFKQPTPIQSEAWPILLKGHNLVGVSETGSGKTLGYAIPALWHIVKQEKSPVSGPRVLIIAPVRELASQIQGEFSKYCSNSNIKSVVLCGGNNKREQLRQLYGRPQIAVCTPGRLSDLVNSGALSLQNISYVVLDEADRLLDMGFEQAIRAILSQIRPDRHISLFTATWPKEVRALASELMGSSFYRLNVGNSVSPAKSVSQHIEFCHEHEKLELLAGVLRLKKEEHKHFKALVFCNQKYNSEMIANFLKGNDFKAACFHGGMLQEQRTRAFNNFKAGRLDVLIASDAAARGLDVSDISLVVNHDFPMDMETYIHRIGRTGRAGAKGESITFVTGQEQNKFPQILKLLTLGNQPVPPELLQSIDAYQSGRGGSGNGRSGNGRGGSGSGNGRGGRVGFRRY